MLNSPVEEIKNRLDIVQVIGGYIKLHKAGVNYRAVCPFHNEKKPSFFVSPARQIWHCFGSCFPNGSLIKTEKGYHAIEKIKEGQKVLTHRGRYMPIVGLFKRFYSGNIIGIRVCKNSDVVSLTEDHKVYVIKTKNCKQRSRENRICQERCSQNCLTKYFNNYKIEKIPVSKVSKNDYLLFPIDRKIEDVDVINLENYLTRKISFYTRRVKKFPYLIKVNKDFLQLLGYWIAEGSADNYGHVQFSLGSHEKEFAEDIIKLVKKIFNLSCNAKIATDGSKSLYVRANSSNLGNIFNNLCGKGALNKHIPFEFQHLPPKKQKILVDAIFRGNGNFKKVAKTTTNRLSKEIGTISLVLSEQLKDILLRNNIVPTITVNKPRIDKKRVKHKKSYIIGWQEDIKLHYADIAEIDNVSYALLPVKEIKKRKFRGDVYNLAVLKDHSYVANNFVVSNCGEGGDIFKFVMKIEGIEFGDALRLLAQKAGVELKRQDSKMFASWQTERQRLFEITELACSFFEKQLQSSGAGQKAKQYLLKRGISEESIKKWRLGYAPDVWSGVSDFLAGKGYNLQEIQKAGLSLKSEKTGRFFDRFRGRIIFPIFNLSFQPIGFGGRTLKKEETAKYINSPATLLYDKSRVLYGLNKAGVATRKKDACILVEGYTDVIMLSQAGFENVAATSGTALTSYQLKIIKRYSDNLYTAFDMDLAGDSATKRGIDLAQAEGFNIKIIKMPQDKDPAEAVLENPESFKNLLENAESIHDFYFKSALAKFDKSSLEGKKEILKFLLPVIKKISNKVEKSIWIKDLAEAIEAKEEDILEELNKVNLPKENFASTKEELKTEVPLKTRKELLEERLISLFAKSPSCIASLSQEDLKLFSLESISFINYLQNNKKGENKAIEDKINHLYLKAEIEEGIDSEKEISCCFKELKSLGVKEKLSKICQDIKKAEKENDAKKVQELIQKFCQYSKIRNNLEVENQTS